jgi:uncharacterized membrane protein YkvA (DUF1232 family)
MTHIRDEDELRRSVAEKARSMTEQDAKKVAGRERELERKLRDLPGTLSKLVNQVKLLFELVRAYVDGSYRTVPWASIAMSVAAVLYFLAPIDLIPDFIPVLGYLDDALVVRFAIGAIQADLRNYCEAKGYDQSIYFDP